MTSERAQSSWWEPTWRRLVGSTLVLFVVILAFLVGRVRAGADPGLARSAPPVTQSAPPAASGSSPGLGGGSDQQSQGVDPNDNFGNAVPDGPSGGTQSVDPPSTHVS